MIWKKLLSDFLLYTAIEFPVLVLILWKTVPHFSPHFLAVCALGAVGLSLGIVGSEELRRGSHRRIHRLHSQCLGIFFVIFGAIFIIMLSTKTLVEGTIDVFVWANLAIFAAKFPLALYLNRNQNNSTSQPATDNAS